MIRILLVVAVAAFSGCQRTEPVRHYREIVLEPEAADPHAGLDLSSMALPSMQQTDDPALKKMLEDSVADVPIAWQVPAGWQAYPGDGMRLATFKSEGRDPITCTIVSLGGMAGGLEENVIRWARQIQLELGPAQLKTLLEANEILALDNGMVITIIDFTRLQPADDTAASDSMIAAILNLEDLSTVFLKMTGTKQAVAENREAFLDLCRSLRLVHE